MTKIRAIEPDARAAKLVALAALLVGALLIVPSARPGGGGITSVNPATPTATSGVSFSVSSGGGNRDFASIRVTCNDDSGAIVYGTTLTVEVPAKGTGESQKIYPPASSCVAELVKLMQIGKAHVLDTESFTVTP